MKYLSVCSGVEAASQAWDPLGWEPVAFSEIEPFPCAVLASRFPSVPNLGDMSKIHYDKGTKELTNGSVSFKTDIDLLVGGTPCFVAGTMVLTPSGYRAIEELAVGDKVVSASGKIQTVEAVGSKYAEVGELKVLGRPAFTCTANHPFHCIEMKRDCHRKAKTYSRKIPVGYFTKTRADEAVGKYAALGMFEETEAPTMPKCYKAKVEDIIELAGWYVGDGYIRRDKVSAKKCVVFALCAEEKIERFRARFEGIVNFCEADGKIIVSCTALADWLLANFNEHSGAKRIPYWMYGNRCKGGFLDGYRATDGHKFRTGWKYSTISPALAYGIADLCGNASVRVHRVSPTCEIEGRIVNQHDYYVIQQTDGETPRTKRINGRYASIVRSYENGSANGPVRRRVYNITVSEEHTYIANGIATYNCQGFSVAGLRKGLSEDNKSGLARHYIRLINEIQPRWFVFENVPGLLSSRTFAEQDGKSGRVLDFNFLLYSFAECGYDLEWRVLDTQYTKVPDFIGANGRVSGFPYAIPQRRRRVFVVGRRNDGRGMQPFGRLATDGGGGCEVLLEQEGLRGDPPPRRVKGKGVAGNIAKGARGADGTVGVECLTQPEFHPQTHRVYGTGGAYSTLISNGGKAGQDQSGVLVRVGETSVAHLFDCLASQSIERRSNKEELGETCRSQDNACGVGLAISYDGYNQSASEECTMPLRTANGSEGVDRTVKVAISFKVGQSAVGGLGIDEGACQTMQSKMSALEPTVAIRTGHTKANGCGFQEDASNTLGAVDVDAVAVPVAMRGNRAPDNRGKFPETDGNGAACSLTSVQTDSMVAIGIDSYNLCSTGDVGRTVSTSGSPEHSPCVALGVDFYNQTTSDTSMTLASAAATDKNHIGGVAIGIGRDAFNSGANALMGMSITEQCQPPMTAKGPGGVLTA